MTRREGRVDAEPRRRVLIVEDEGDLADLISYNLQREGYQCDVVNDGDEAVAIIQQQAPDLIVLDRMLPGLSGDEIAARLRRESHLTHIPFIMLTAKVEESDQLVGFALGADDYITKPFSMKLLVARVGALLRRTRTDGDDPDTLVAGPIILNPARHQLSVDGEEVALTATEFRLLRTLMASRGRVMDRAQLIDAVIGSDIAVTDRTIDVHITSLRRKLGAASVWVQTVRGVGYTFRQPSRTATSA